MEKDQEILETIIKAIVKNPKDVEIKREVDSMGVLLRIWVNRKDMGLLIGKRGVHANAIKLIMKVIGFKDDTRIAIKIEEPEYEEEKIS